MADANHPDLLAVLDEHLAPGESRGRPLSPSERFGWFMSAGRAREEPAALDPDIATVLRLIGLDPNDPAGASRQIAGAIDASADAIDRADVPAVLQAYARGIGRIVAAEAAVVVRLVRAAPEDDRPGVLGRALEALVPAARRGFQELHRQLLHDALRAELGEDQIDHGQPEHLAVAMVDFVGSTRYLVETGPQELEELVDLLFEGAQWATAQRPARVVKYVGDGVFIAGSDVTDVAEVALDLVALLESGSPLRARGGVTFGNVLQRAGDIFGLPVNRAQVLTKAARPGTVVADETAAAGLPTALRARPRNLALPHPALGQATVVTVRRR